MKKTMRFISALLSSLLICGAVAVSADDTAASETTAEEPVSVEVTDETEVADEAETTDETEVADEAETTDETEVADETETSDETEAPVYTEATEIPVFLAVEGPTENYLLTVGNYLNDGSVSAADVIADATELAVPGTEIVGLDEGYISSFAGVESGIYGGYDGWLYAVKYFEIDEAGNLTTIIDIPVVGIDDYAIDTACLIVLYYGDFDLPFADYVFTEDGMVQLNAYTAVYDENYMLVDFEGAPLAGGSFEFTPVYTDEETGEITYGEKIVFTADENGVTELDAEFKALENGYYIGSITKQSEETYTVGDAELTKPEVIRMTDFFVVYNEPEEVVDDTVEKVNIVLIGMLA